ncbi:MAG: ABC transporter ATP-binding protein [Paracoccus sp. (in: a-proteobacteria)]|nr:ABC transporter ATP-binding protein [Paracoccus sp. (in: a-proteobacteria)]
MLDLRALTLRRGPCAVIDGVDLSIAGGEFVGLIGPNGAGKTTLLRGALGLMSAEGESSVAAMPPAARARHAAFMPQGRQIAWPMPVEAVVALGRIAHPKAAGPADRRAVAEAIKALGLTAMRRRDAQSLSGGEQARVLLARALAQDTPLLIADEPIAGLDPAAQIAVMTLFRRLADRGRAVVAALHDLGLAVRHCTRLIVIDRGRLVADGPPRTVLTPDLLADVFRISAHLSDGPDGPIFQPLTTLEEQNLNRANRAS